MSWLMLAASACRGDASTDRADALPEPIPEVIPGVDSPLGLAEAEARLTRIDIYGAAADEAAGARVVLLFEGAPLFQQRQLPE